MEVLAIYLAGSIIIILLVVLVLIGYGLSHKEPGTVGVGVGLGFSAILLFWFSVEEYYEPRDCFEEGAKWADSHSKSPWISVDEKLPPVEKDGLSIKVLVISTKGKIDFSRYDYDMGGWISPILDIIFTHWMLIPEPPKE